MENQKEKKRLSKSNSSLPLDLILEILLRLPEKSVGRFRSVSKLWLSITTDPYFINLFGNRSHRPSLLLCFKEDDKLFVSSILQHNQDMKDSYSCFKKFQECSLLPHTESVNGLICFQKSATPIIWNSSTKQYVSLPKPNIGWEYLTVLLGYDPIEGKHKLVCMPFQKSCDVCHVLTLGSVRESWRTVKNNHNHRSHYHTTGRCIKGVVYYLAYVHSTRVIMSFDVRLEKFDMIQLPSDHIHENVVTTYKGRLACVENFTTKDGRIICKDGKMVWEDSITLWILEDPEQHKWSSKDILAPFGQCDESLNAYFKDRGINVAGVFLYKSSSFPDLDYIIHFNRVMNTFEKIRVIRRRADGKARLYNKAKNRRMNQRFLHPSVIDPKAKEGQDANIEMALSDEVKIETKGRDQTAAQAPTRTSSGSKKYVHWNPELVSGSQEPDQKPISSYPAGSNPYIARSPAETSTKDTMETVKGALGRWGRKVAEAAKKTESLAGNTWQHHVDMGRIAHNTNVLAEGGYEKIFRQTFETVPEEQLLNSFACYLSTSAGPVMGVLYISTAKLAYCSDNPLSYKNDGQTEWSYYKVVIPLHQLKAVNPSTSIVNPAEKYIQVISVDNHEFWFMGFLNYEGAVTSLQDSLQAGALRSV